jgi:hypothetical protein
MASDDTREPAPRRWLGLGIWFLVSAGVFWCSWTGLQEWTLSARVVARQAEPEFVTLATPDQRVIHRLSAVAGVAALTAGLISSAMGRGSLPYLMFAATVTGMTAVIAGIEWLLLE